MYQFTKGILLYSGTFPTFGNPVEPGARFQIDTTNLASLQTFQDEDEFYEYFPPQLDSIYGIIMWKLTDYDTGAREQVAEFQLGVDFTVGDLIDITSYVEAEPAETIFFFSVVGPYSYNGTFEVPTETIFTEESGSLSFTSLFDVPDVGYDQIEKKSSSSGFVISTANDFIGFGSAFPETDIATIELLSLVPPLTSS